MLNDGCTVYYITWSDKVSMLYQITIQSKPRNCWMQNLLLNNEAIKLLHIEPYKALIAQVQI